MVKNGQKWLEMVDNGWKWLEMVREKLTAKVSSFLGLYRPTAYFIDLLGFYRLLSVFRGRLHLL